MQSAKTWLTGFYNPLFRFVGCCPQYRLLGVGEAERGRLYRRLRGRCSHHADHDAASRLDRHVLFPSEPRLHPSRSGRNPLRPLHHTLRYGSTLRTGHAFRIGNRGRHPRLRAGRPCHDLQNFRRFITSVRRGRRAGSLSDKAGSLPHAVGGASRQSVRHRIFSDESYWESPYYHSWTARRSTESVVTEMFHLLLEYLSR